MNNLVPNLNIVDIENILKGDIPTLRRLTRFLKDAHEVALDILKIKMVHICTDCLRKQKCWLNLFDSYSTNKANLTCFNYLKE